MGNTGGGEIMQYSEEYTDSYRGISFSIRKWRFAAMDAKIDPRFPEAHQVRWNYYIYLFPEMFKEYDFDKFKGEEDEFGYNDYASELHSIHWHGGCTYAEDKGECLKAGCDYSHIDDEGRTYCLDDIIRDVKFTIDTLFIQKPDLYIRCMGDGKYRHNSAFDGNSKCSMPYLKKIKKE